MCFFSCLFFLNESDMLCVYKTDERDDNEEHDDGMLSLHLSLTAYIPHNFLLATVTWPIIKTWRRY